jgi:hypothetical protein
VGEKKGSKLAMQSNFNGPSIVIEQAKKINGSRRQEAWQEFKIPLLSCKREMSGLQFCQA